MARWDMARIVGLHGVDESGMTPKVEFAAVKEPNPFKGLLCAWIISTRKTNNNK